MKQLVLTIIFISTLIADSINISASVGNKHFLPFELNEKNGGIGIGYQYDYNEDVAINVDYLQFVNSYLRDTTFIWTHKSRVKQYII